MRNFGIFVVVVALALGSASAHAASFNSDLEGWTSVGFDVDAVIGFPPSINSIALVSTAGDMVHSATGGNPGGYAMLTDTFNSERAAPGLWLVDLYVRAEARRGGVAQKLMAAVAAEAKARGAESVWWGVRNTNEKAIAFYKAVGAKDDDARILELDGADLTRLAAETER